MSCVCVALLADAAADAAAFDAGQRKLASFSLLVACHFNGHSTMRCDAMRCDAMRPKTLLLCSDSHMQTDSIHKKALKVEPEALLAAPET